MEVNKNILQEKISLYSSKKISRSELGKWALEAYYVLMKGEYIELEKICVYHFLREISSFHKEPDDFADEFPCTKERVLEIGKILRGEKNTQYTFCTKISKTVSQSTCQGQYNEFHKIHEICLALNSSDIPPDMICCLKEYVNRDMGQIQTLLDLFEIHIRGILKENIDFDESILDYCQSAGIYVGLVNREMLIPNLKKFLECALGEKSFRISIIYHQGFPKIALVL